MLKKELLLTLYFFIFLFSVNFSIGQNKIDSLKIELTKTETTDIDKVKILGEISELYKIIEPNEDSMFAYAKKSEQLAIKINHTPSIINSYLDMGDLYTFQNKYTKAIEIFNKAIAKSKEENYLKRIAHCYNNLGIIYDEKGDFEAATKNYLLALKYIPELEQDERDTREAIILSNLGIIYKKLKEYDTAIKYYTQSQKIFLKIDHGVGITSTYGNMGAVFLRQKNYNKADEYLTLGIKNAKERGMQLFVPYFESNYAILQDSLKNYIKAEKFYKSSLEAHSKNNNTYEIAFVANAYSKHLLIKNNSKSALSFAQLAVEKSREANAKEMQKMAYESLSLAYKKSNQYKKSLEAYEQFKLLDQELFEESKTKAVLEYQTKYETEKKEKEIVLQKQEILDQELEIKNKTLLGISFLGLLIIVSLWFWSITRRNQLKRKQLAKELELKEALSIIETQNKLQEQRLEISRDLHDNIGSQLTFIISSVDNLKFTASKLENTFIDKLDNISNFTQETIHQLRDTIWAMNKNDISLEEFSSRLYSYIQKAIKIKPDIKIQFRDKTEYNSILTSKTGMHLYRVLQELINNSLKHSQASKIEVSINTTKQNIVFSVADNGIGFDKKQITSGNGLNNIVTRIESIGGTVTTDTSPNKGCKTTIKILKP